MKTKFRVLLVSIFVLGIAIVYSTSCKKAASLAYTCSTEGTGCATIKYCVNSSTSGYYEWNGTKYNFTAATLEQAATDVVNAMMAGCYKKSGGVSGESEKLYFEQLKTDLVDQTNISVESAKLE